MKKDNPIRDAIDESLYGIRFNAEDMRSVLRATRSQDMRDAQPPRRRESARRHRRLDFAFAMVMAVMVIAPLSVFAFKAQSARTTSIAAAPGQTASVSAPTAQPGEDVILTPVPESTPPSAGAFTESEAIRIARDCFSELCDTTVFTFEEYTVSTGRVEGEDGREDYLVSMNSIYDNGCSFSVVIDPDDGSVLSTSTPRLATVPTHLNSASAEVQSWYEKNGPYIFTWAPEDQAEFSRRYEGCTLRLPREGEISSSHAESCAVDIAFSLLPENKGSLFLYTVLYSERSFGDGVARYQVYAFTDEIIDTLPETYALITLRASDGTVESSQLLSTAGLEN